jgi:uncharacterized protein
MMKTLETKLTELLALLKKLESVVVAYSGGVDSAFLAAAAQRALGGRAIAVTAVSESFTGQEKSEAILVAQQIGIKHLLLPTAELLCPEFTANTKDRCYFCKKVRLQALWDWGQKKGYDWVIEGSNADDLGDYRPGLRSVAELERVKSPLIEAGFRKAEIRELSRQWALPTWDKSSAACLVSRLAYGLPITAWRLRQIERAERLIKQYCPGQVRVRHHGELARIELEPVNIPLLTNPAVAGPLVKELNAIGFLYVTVDLLGYQTGSMDKVLKERGTTG